ncbi:unnamed protein product, partial [Mesorhabditis belari]|uniref:Uncharacterized protein n=1 Tax=Mesorhabditis belari TaxID=2138241 RepID=A0AAF3ERS8_9BILA
MKLSVLLFIFSFLALSMAHYAKYPQELKAKYPKYPGQAEDLKANYPKYPGEPQIVKADYPKYPKQPQDLKANYPKGYPEGQKCAYGMRYDYICGDRSCSWECVYYQ